MTPTASRPSILELLTERQAATTVTVEQLREQIAALTDQLTTAETELAELAITRKTLLSLNSHADPPPVPADATIASPAYQQILAVFHTATDAMRAKDICHASAPVPPPATPKASAQSSNASSPARSWPNPNPACSPSPRQRRPRSPGEQHL